MLSRFPLPDRSASVPTTVETFVMLEHLLTIPLTAAKIKQQTKCGPILFTIHTGRMASYFGHSGSRPQVFP